MLYLFSNDELDLIYLIQLVSQHQNSPTRALKFENRNPIWVSQCDEYQSCRVLISNTSWIRFKSYLRFVRYGFFSYRFVKHTFRFARYSYKILPGKYFISLEDVLKTSSGCLQSDNFSSFKTSRRSLMNMSSRILWDQQMFVGLVLEEWEGRKTVSEHS